MTLSLGGAVQGNTLTIAPTISESTGEAEESGGGDDGGGDDSGADSATSGGGP
jgi:hypothetical protein